MSDLPIKPISEIEEKVDVSENDRILILDSVSEEARLASKDELKGVGIASITATKQYKTTTITITETDGTVTTFNIEDWSDGKGAWDMLKGVYDPMEINGDAFDYENFYNTPTVNTRQFILPSLSSLTIAQEIYEYAVWWNGAVIRYNNEDYFLSWFDNGDPIFLRTKLGSDTSNDWTNTYMKDTGLKFTIVSANVTAISVVNNTNPWYLATGVNYATPYIPEYPWSPATKKYVDDSSVQVTTLPIASETEVGNIYQYIWETNVNYRNGYFYQCIEWETPWTYQWTAVNVQQWGGSWIVEITKEDYNDLPAYEKSDPTKQYFIYKIV